MHSRSYPILDEEEDPLVERFLVGVDRPTAKVLAYLLARSVEPDVDPDADRLAIRVGTGLGRTQTADALAALERRELTTKSTAPVESSGRPPERWRAAVEPDSAITSVRNRHAEALLERARDVAEGLEPAAGADVRSPATPADSSLTVCLNWAPNGLQAALFVAADSGAFHERGLDVEIEHRHGSRPVTSAVAAGDADVGLAGAATLLRARASGDPLVPVARWSRRALAVLYTTRDVFGEPFTSVEQLRGRRVATTTDSETGILGRLLLSQADVLADVTLDHVEGEEQRALLDGRADAATGVVTDPGELAATDDVDVLPVAEHYPVPGPALVVHRASLDDSARADDLVQFLAALMSGWTALREDPEHGARVVADHSDASPASERRRVDAILERFAADVDAECGWGWQSPETWTRLETALTQSGLLEADP